MKYTKIFFLFTRWLKSKGVKRRMLNESISGNETVGNENGCDGREHGLHGTGLTEGDGHGGDGDGDGGSGE